MNLKWADKKPAQGDNMTERTAGEWKFADTNGFLIVRSGDKVIATVHRQDMPRSEARKNGEIIARAPEVADAALALLMKLKGTRMANLPEAIALWRALG